LIERVDVRQQVRDDRPVVLELEAAERWPALG
jgi:hypothetical protein